MERGETEMRLIEEEEEEKRPSIDIPPVHGFICVLEN
jgi:hypothetical protein